MKQVIKINIAEQIKWYCLFNYYKSLYPNESIQVIINLINKPQK